MMILQRLQVLLLKTSLIPLFIFSSLSLQATTYYVDSKAGNNSNSGTSISSPWRTLSQVEATTLLPGDSVLMKAGSCFREAYDIDASGTAGNYIYHGRYGTGVNPVITGAEKAITWVASGTTNVWQCSNALTNTSDDFYGGRLFFFDTDTIVYGDYKPYVNLSELTEEFDYTANGTVHYVYSTIDPDLVYDSIEVTQREYCIYYNFNDYLIFDGIDVQMGQRQGYFEGYPAPRGVTDLIWRNCFVGYTGAKGSGSAYGITAFASNILIENCRFQDNGRRAISINTYTDEVGGRRIENIIIRNNVFTRGHHTTSLDLSTMNRTGDTVMNVYFYNNYIDDSGIDTLGNWGNSNQLFTQAGINTSYMSKIYIIGNTFVQATARNIQLENGYTYYMWNNTFVGHNYSVMSGSPYGNVGVGGADTLYFANNIGYCNIPDNTWENNILHGYATNCVYPNRNYNLYYSEYPKADRNFTSILSGGTNYFYRTTQWATYKSQFPSYDVNSPTPANPNFVNFAGKDFTLSENSPAKYASDTLPMVVVTDPFGVVDTVNKYDMNGVLRNPTTPSIGAYEYDPIRTGFNSLIDTVYTSSGSVYNMLDRDFATAWNVYGTPWAIFKFTENIIIDNFALAVYLGTERDYYFSLETSTDSTNWTTVLDDTTYHMSDYLETYFFTKDTARYIRLTSKGNSANSFSNYTEIHFPPTRSSLPENNRQSDSSYKVLFIGNSYTEQGPVPVHFQNLAATHGWPAPDVTYRVIGGANLSRHWTDATTMGYVNQGNWDYVVLQDYSWRAYEEADSLAIDMVRFYDTIKQTSPNAKIVLYETWGTIQNIATQELMYSTWSDSLIAVWQGWQDIITDGYHNAADSITDNATYSIKTDTIIAPVGEMWSKHFHGDTLFRLHDPSDNHANVDGEYLNALTIYNKIYNIKTTGAGYWKTTEYYADHFQALVDDATVSLASDTGSGTPVLSNETDILTFAITNQLSSTVNSTNHTVTISMPYGTVVTSLTPTITVSTGATINPLSGVARNFTSPVTYTVTAEDTTTQQVWTVTVNIASQNQVIPLRGETFMLKDLDGNLLKVNN